MSFQTTLRAILLLPCLLMVVCCKSSPKDDSPAKLALGHQLPDLVFAKNAPRFNPTNDATVEAQWTDGVWKIHDQGAWIADCSSKAEIHQALKGIREKHPESKILISAGAKPPFRQIRDALVAIASTGFTRVHFLVTTETAATEDHVFLLDFPIMSNMQQPEIQPVLIRLNNNSSFFVGYDDTTSSLDANPTNHSLPELSKILDLYTNAAKAANSLPLLQIYVEPDAMYQRFVDLLATLHEHQITQIYITDVNTPTE